jgi:hypothetical protein
MADVTAIRNGLKDALATVSGLKVYAYMPIKPEPPAAGIAVRTASLDLDMDGNGKYTFDVWLYAQASDLMVSQARLDAFISDGTSSIKAAIDADRSLGGVCDYARMTGWTEGPRLVDAAGTQLLAMA